ncbi:Uncharacterised protein [Vibrio cholerae]|nr:Uncharacterised protein [Vibrio cholerae]
MLIGSPYHTGLAAAVSSKNHTPTASNRGSQVAGREPDVLGR